MNDDLRGRGRQPGRMALDAAAAVRHLIGLGHSHPILLAAHPVARMNPYQSLLYSRAWEAGIAPVPLYDLAELDDLRAVADAAGVPLVLHLHWTNRILESAPDPAAARDTLDAFVAALDAFIASGGSVVWTVHNVLPHDSPTPGLDAELQQAIVDRATVVHVLSENAPSAVAEWFTIPRDRMLFVPHPNYIGAYIDTISAEEARWELGLDPDDTVYALLGAIKPYKGGDHLLAAFEAASERDPGRRRLVVAGPPSADPAVGDFLERCALNPFITVHARKIPSDEMQVFLRSADVAVLPYVRSLNSGVLFLALSFGLPVVAPAVGGIAEIVTPEFARTFAPGDPDALTAALLAADELRTPDAREAAFRAARAHDPVRLSREFARGVAERVLAARATPV